ncbi:MAG: hypothetical protein VKL42_17760 [Snowella sp.]|nr:hypothetical protein [Snowella sp.]
MTEENTEKDTGKDTEKSKEAFQQKLDKKDWFGAFISAVEDAVNLEVATVIEDINDPSSRGKSAKEIGESGKVLYTRINLVQGDIVNIFGREFITEPANQPLMEFHKEQVLDGKNVIKNNIETLKSIIEYAMKFKQNTVQENPTNSPSS